MPLWLRDAREDDVELLFDIRTSVLENRQSREELASLGITAESIARMLTTDAKAWICDMLAQPVEPLGVTRILANQRERTVFALFVRPEHEGRGAGRTLFSSIPRPARIRFRVGATARSPKKP